MKLFSVSIKRISLLVIFFTYMLMFLASISAVEKTDEIEAFPESYRPYLYRLKERYPEWSFVAFDTGLDWNTVINKESYLSGDNEISLSPVSWERVWHRVLQNGNLITVEPGWVTASDKAVSYTIDPRNFLNEITIFQFQAYTYDSKIHTLQGVEKILYGTEMSEIVTQEVNGKTQNVYKIKDITYHTKVDDTTKLVTTYQLNLRESPSVSSASLRMLDVSTELNVIEYVIVDNATGIWSKVSLADGTTGYICRVAADGTVYAKAGTKLEKVVYYYDKDGDGVKESTMTYAEAYIKAAEETGINPYSLALRTKNETNCAISNNTQICGINSQYPGCYNYYSIGAYGTNPALNGVIYAYRAGWNDPVTAIVEGAKFWGREYITAGQYTPYLQKFNINPNSSNALYTHQYMTDVTCIYREAFGMYSTFSDLEMLEGSFQFIIPVFNNMPEVSYDIYTDYEGYFTEDSTEITVNQETTIYALLPTTATYAREISLLSVPAGSTLTRLKIGEVSSFDKVKYEIDGSAIYGYIYYNTYSIEATEDNTKLVCDVTTLHVRENPRVSAATIYDISKGEIVTRIEKNSEINETGIWDKVRLANGKTGYVCRKHYSGEVYLSEYKYTKVTDVLIKEDTITLKAGEKACLDVSVLPENAEFNSVSYTIENNNVAAVDENGCINGISEGETKIEAKNEDQNKSDECKIVVVPNISFDKAIYELIPEETNELKVNIVGTTLTEYIIEIVSGDENITLDGNNVTAINIGEVEIKVYLKDKPQVEATTKIIIKEEHKKTLISFNDSSLVIEENIILGINPETKLNELSPNISSDYEISYIDLNSNVLSEDAIIGTGTKVVISKQDDEIIYEIVIIGDISGDGHVNSLDLLMIRRHMLEISILEGNSLRASNISKNDDQINSLDLLMIRRHMLGIESIKQ